MGDIGKQDPQCLRGQGDQRCELGGAKRGFVAAQQARLVPLEVVETDDGVGSFHRSGVDGVAAVRREGFRAQQADGQARCERLLQAAHAPDRGREADEQSVSRCDL